MFFSSALAVRAGCLAAVTFLVAYSTLKHLLCAQRLRDGK